jgi:hypothetical protein
VASELAAATLPRATTPRARGSRGQAWVWATALLTAGAFATTILAAPAAGTAPASGLAWLLFVGSSVHVAATGWLFALGEVRAHARAHPARYVWIPLALVAGGAVTAAALSPAGLVWPLLGYFAWQFVHFQKQNLGMVALAASSLRVRGLDGLERRALTWAGIAGTAGVVAHPGLLGLELAHGPQAVFWVAASGFACAVAAGLLALARRPRAARPAGYCAVFGCSLLFFAPVFTFASPYAAVGTMTVAHGLQYLLLVGLVAGGGHGAGAGGVSAGDGRGARAGRRARIVRVVVLVNLALAAGAALSAASHLHDAGPAGRLLFGAYLGAVMAHFVVDAGLWRLREEFPRRFLSARVPYLVAPREARDGRLRPQVPSRDGRSPRP